MDNGLAGHNIVFVGCGNIAHMHMRFLTLAGLTVNAVCDSSKIRLEEFADKYGIEKRYVNFDEMLAVIKPTVVHVLTPPQSHYSLVLKALEAGCHVMVEKPLCESLAEYQVLSDFAQSKGLQLSVDHTQVYNPMIMKARALCESGVMGKIVRIEYAYDNPSIIKSLSDESGYRWAKGTPPWFALVKGGVAVDLLPHALSILLSFDQGLRLAHAHARTLTGGVIEELSTQLISDVTDASINISLNQRPLKNILSIYCENGSIRIDLRNLFCVYQPERRLPGIISRVCVAISESWQIITGFTTNVVRLLLGKIHTYDGLKGIFDDFYRSLSAKQIGELPLIHAARVTELIEEIINATIGKQPNEDEYMAVKTEEQRLKSPADNLITGGTGFIGLAITNKFLEQNRRVRVYCRSTSNRKRLPESVGLAFGDLRNLAKLSDAMTGIKTVVHCAAAISGDWADYYESTVVGTKNVLNAIENSSVDRLVYISSLGVLDFNNLRDGNNVDESSRVEPNPEARGYYTRAKVEAEELVVEFAKKNSHVKVVILRPGLVFGNESNNNIQNCGLLLDKLLLVFGCGGRKLGLNYVENLANAVLNATDADIKTGTIIQVVDKEQPTVKEIINEHNRLSTNKIYPVYIPISVWKLLFIIVDMILLILKGKIGTFRYRFASNSKILNYGSDFAHQLLGQYCSYNFTESIERAYMCKLKQE